MTVTKPVFTSDHPLGTACATLVWNGSPTPPATKAKCVCSGVRGIVIVFVELGFSTDSKAKQARKRFAVAPRLEKGPTWRNCTTDACAKGIVPDSGKQRPLPA